MDFTIKELKNLYKFKLVNGHLWNAAVLFGRMRLDSIYLLPKNIYDGSANNFLILLSKELKVISKMHDFIKYRMSEGRSNSMKACCLFIKKFHDEVSDSIGKHNDEVRLGIMNLLEDLYPILQHIGQYLSKIKMEHINSVHSALGDICKCEWCKRNPYSVVYDKDLEADPVAFKPLIIGHSITYY